MNELQSSEFDILKVFVGICEKHGLDYYLVCGSALGAVKYGGFIPWDDDVDVALPRKDYDRFVEIAKNELPDNFFLQNYKSDKYFPPIYSKLRNKATAFIEKGSETLDIVHGVYIDVFPLDGHPGGGIAGAIFELKKKIYVAGIAADFRHDSRLKEILYIPLKLAVRVLPRGYFAARYEKLVRKYPPESSELWCNYGNSKLKVEYAPREQYGAGADARFEEITVRVPSDSDAYLTQKYGDWRADLPEDQKVGHHFYAVCDLDRPYTDYVVPAGRGKIGIRSVNK